MMAACKLCSIKPQFKLDPYVGRQMFTGRWDNEITIATGSYTVLCCGVDADGRIRLTAEGDGEADYYPKFCPECGRRLTDG